MPGLSYRGATATIADALVRTISVGYRVRDPAAATVADLRAVATKSNLMHALTDNAIRHVTSAGAVYRWDESSTAADDGADVIKPDDAGSSAGRWRKDATALRNSSGTLIYAATSGYLRQVAYYDGERQQAEFEKRIYGQRPCVVVDFIERDKARRSTERGDLAWATYRFQIHAIAHHARGDERGFRGSFIGAENTPDPGAWAVAEDVEFLLDGAKGDALGVSAISHVEIGTMRVTENDLSGRLAIVTLDCAVYATIGRSEEYSPALSALDAQMQIAQPRTGDSVDPDDVRVTGLRILRGLGRSKAPTDGSAIVGGVTVNVAGAALHTFTANRDTYRDLSNAGAWTYTETTLGGVVPDPAAGSLRIARTRADATGITEDEILCDSLSDFSDPLKLLE